MRRILMVVDHLGANGTVTHVISLAKELKKMGHHIVIAGREGSKLSEINSHNIPFYSIDFPATFSPSHFEYNRVENNMMEIIQNENISLIHGHQVYSGIIAAKCAKVKNLPFIYTVHGLYSQNYELNMVAGYASKLIAVSPYVFSQLSGQFPEKLVLILNGVDETEFNPKPGGPFRKELGIQQDRYVILYASRLEWIKADICMQLIQAVNQLKHSDMPDIELLILGEGKRQAYINETSRFYCMNKKEAFIKTMGSQCNLQDYYGISDCVVGTGRTALEALLCEKNVIAAGNKGFLGHVTIENWEQAKNAHFGDHFALKSYGKAEFIRSLLDLRRIQSLDETQLLRETVIRDYSIVNAAIQHLSLYP
ncbi:glycosyltransferase [Cytobacillus gottheilii]|uniref:glycosyltransferase n=1 Tax=Cytobacillus gottheilii TaxID=859144 RepID=UPI00249450B9|nr:glycosyltransferase [Cytobacillus gottheilii]